jgi:hypothetical protein
MEPCEDHCYSIFWMYRRALLAHALRIIREGLTMGSFNQTCGLTHLPIQVDDPVVGFALAKSHAWTSDSVDGYSTSAPHWQAVSLPFSGRYNDYGFAQDIDPRQADVSLRASCGVPFAELASAAENGKGLEVDLGSLGGKSRLMVMFVHAAVYERLSSSTVTAFGRKVDFSVEEARIPEFLEIAARASAKRWARVGIEVESAHLFDRLSEADEDWVAETGRNWAEVPYLSDFFSRKAKGLQPRMTIELVPVLGRLHGEGKANEARALLGECLRMVIFDENLAKLRRQWAPQSGLGSDATDFELHSEIARWTAERCEKRLSCDYDDPNGEEDVSPPGP